MSNPKSEYVEKQKQICQAKWFKDHKAGFTENSASTIINWQNPGSWNYGCRFIIHRRWLIVVGDIGEAVYEWGQDVTLEFLAGLDFHYFHGKCQASPEGRKFEQWDTAVAKVNIQARIAELKALPEDEQADSHKAELEALEDVICFDRVELEMAAGEFNSGTGDGETASGMCEYGIVPSVHAIGIFIGLQMAIKQLTHPPTLAVDKP